MRSYPPRSSQLIGQGQIARPVFGIDIDGTISEYHNHFCSFAENWLGRHVPSGDSYDGTEPFAKHIGVSKTTYRKMKLSYRQGGFKRWMPVKSGASRMTRSLRDRGAEIVICTTRPYLSLENVDGDTRHWLERNGIQYDEIIWGEHKYKSLMKARGHRVVAVLEDLPELCLQAVEAGVPVVFQVLSKYSYNYGGQLHWRDPINTVIDIDEAERELHNALTLWENKFRGRLEDHG